MNEFCEYVCSGVPVENEVNDDAGGLVGELCEYVCGSPVPNEFWEYVCRALLIVSKL